jgi:Domain of unknown function (DUF4150)
MSVTIKVNGTSNSLVHKGSNHFARNTPPDVCKTPSPGGPVPIPYPVIMSTSGDLADGSTTVKVDGGNSAATKGSNFSRCNGDEAGTAGGVVSSTNMKEATWITYSFDVKIEGQNACRLTDKMKMNHGNTVCMVGLGGMPCRVSAATIKAALCEELCNYQNSRKKNKSSKKLEDACAKDPKWKASGVSFTKSFPLPGFSTANTIPDAVHEVGSGRKQCFDFKLCGKKPGAKKGWTDSFRGDQIPRQTALGGGNPPIEISCKECGTCTKPCKCPK